MYISIEKADNGYILDVHTPVMGSVLGEGAEERTQFVFTTVPKLLKKVKSVLGVVKTPRVKMSKPAAPTITVGE